MYSFSEVNDKKSVTIVELTCKGGVETREIELKPMREMKKVRGAFCELMLNPRADFYTHVTLTDENDVPNAISRLRVVYPNAMELIYDNERTRARTGGLSIGEIEKKSIDELFAEFFNQMNGVDMDERQQKYIKKLIEQTEEEL